MIISILHAKYLMDHKIKFRFSDEAERIVDFSRFLKQAKNPMTRKYLNEKLFRDFTIQHGDIIWNDYELCFPIWDLYQGEVLKSGETAAVQN
ncbi:MAG TPA: DUF2442 domain-containing protein [Bacteroidales bacterium]|nr:DUF2442 domain-containing protein [Bacteroidales bacterium]